MFATRESEEYAIPLGGGKKPSYEKHSATRRPSPIAGYRVHDMPLRVRTLKRLELLR